MDMNDNITITIGSNEFKKLLKEVLAEVIQENQLPQREASNIMDIQEAAAFLNLALPTLYAKTSKRIIPHYKQGKKLLFKRSELVAWIESRQVKTAKETKRERLNGEDNSDSNKMIL
jgi:excisionase family DNA binding protein